MQLADNAGRRFSGKRLLRGHTSETCQSADTDGVPLVSDTTARIE